MDSLYAITLVVALAAGVIALLTSLLRLVVTVAHVQLGAAVWKVMLSRRVANGVLALGTFSLAVSIFVHSRWGHGPGTVAPMQFGRLLSEHEAFPTVGAMLILALALALCANRRQRHGSAT